jgi:pyruvate/2-oxoglutarate dehydrogenase complex dihydrolipoamide acyltransferase (E2) component
MTEIKMPEAGFSITEGTVIEWFKEVGETVKEGENVVSVETDKLTVDIPAEKAGVLQEVRYAAGEVVPVGGIMGVILEAGEKPLETKEEVQEEEKPRTVKRPQVRGNRDRRISPAAKILARARGVDVSKIQTGTGPQGRIVKQDVIDFLSSAAAPIEAQKQAATAAFEPVQKTEGTGRARRVEFKGWRKVIADRMTVSSREIPHVTMSVEADVTDLSRTIQLLREKQGLHFTYLPFMMKAMVAGIQEVPFMNALCDPQGFTVLDEINIGIAVDLGEKLIVPVIKQVEQKSIPELVTELDVIIKKAREDKLTPQDIEDGTITITNVGMFQIHSATAIILPPQVAIMYMGAARELPGVWEGRIEIRKKMMFGATYDHRVNNGASVGRFLKKMKECIEDLNVLLMHLR